MKFSIVVLSYNQGKFIQKTIDSVLSQQQEVDLELLVFDRNSTDQTREVLRHYGNQIQWVSEQDRGQADALNKALALASGDIYCCLSSGDLFYKGVLKKIADAFKSHPTARMLYGEVDYIGENGVQVNHEGSGAWNYARLLESCFICQPATFWRKEITLEYGLFDDSLKYAIDYEYWLRVGSQEAPFYFQGEKLASSRVCNSNSYKTVSQNVLVHREILTVVRRYTETPYHWLEKLADIETKERDEKYEYNYIINIIRLSFEYSIPLDGVILSRLMNQLLFPVSHSSDYLMFYCHNKAIFDKVIKLSYSNSRAYSLIKNFIFGIDKLLNCSFCLIVKKFANRLLNSMHMNKLAPRFSRNIF